MTRDPLPGQDVRHQVALGGVDQHVVQAKLFGDADGSGDVVGPVGVEVGGKGPLDHRHQGLQGRVIVRRVLVRVLPAPLDPVRIFQRLAQLLPDQGGSGHPGGGGLVPVAVRLFGVLAQGEFHGRWGQHHHVVHPAAHRLHRRRLTGDGVAAAGAGEHGGDPGLPGLLEAVVHGVQAVDGPQVGGAGVRDLIAVVVIVAQTVCQHPQMAVGVDKAREQMAAPGIQVGLQRRGHWGMGPTRRIFPSAHSTKPVGSVGASMGWTTAL